VNQPSCIKSECTLATTGICLLKKSPQECEHHRTIPISASVARPHLQESQLRSQQRFHTGIEMGTEDAVTISRSSYTRLIGVLGATNSGKTCLLSSLYLLASNGLLGDRFRFAGSLTLKGFEDRARHAREWTSGSFPEQLAEHTRLLDPRAPSLLHMALAETGKLARRRDLLFTDLPGEWTSQLVARADTAARLAFLARADGVIVVLDGPSFASPFTRHTESMNACMLLGRLCSELKLDPSIPLVLAVSKKDQIDGNVPASVEDVAHEARQLGFSPATMATCAFSSNPSKFAAGDGVVDIVAHILNAQPNPPRPHIQSHTIPGRSFLRYGLLAEEFT
jgi:hypothetical protein